MTPANRRAKTDTRRKGSLNMRREKKLTTTGRPVVSRQVNHRYLDHQIIHNHIVKGAAKQSFQLSAAFDLADNGTQWQAVPKDIGATVYNKAWDLPADTANTD
ncbi:MAG: hypothetical protein FRX49_06180 [Trebouxia sp. A1-2]|nr:MAG: hypothetical protein FRX49_06180 [Trebouxia sp. A1-2]